MGPCRPFARRRRDGNAVRAAALRSVVGSAGLCVLWRLSNGSAWSVLGVRHLRGVVDKALGAVRGGRAHPGYDGLRLGQAAAVARS